MRRHTLLAAVVLHAALAQAGENWPQFRGPEGKGRSNAVGLPLQWSEKENVRWKTKIHGRGWSSPVIWGRQIWMTTATEDGHEQYAVCVDRESGKVVHDIHVFHNDKPQITEPLNSHASPTPVVEQGRVYVHFGAYGTACLDTESGRILWSRRDIVCDHFVGPGSSPILVDDLLVFHMDGIDVQYVIGLDKATGQTRWKTNRGIDFGTRAADLRKAFCTPLMIEFAGRRQLICTAAAETMAYDPATGKEFWKVRHEGFSNTAMPLFDGKRVVLNAGFGKQELWAVRPDGQGEVTKTHVAWKLNKAVPQKPSGVLVDELLFQVNDNGIATCVDTATGKIVWQQRLPGQYSSSPITAEGRIYLSNQDGLTTIVAASKHFEKLGANKLDEGFMASPAASGKSLYLRTKTHLYRVEK